MKTLRHKLRSQAGATMILALVFVAFCMFVGGSVLGAAAANRYRQRNSAQQQQLQLDVRSAAMAVAEQLTPASGSDLQLTVVDTVQTVQPINIQTGANTDDAETSRIITARLPAGTELTAMQRLAVETAVWQYLRGNVSADESYRLVLSNFTYDDQSIVDKSQFWFSANLSGSGNLTGSLDFSAKPQNGSALGTTPVSFTSYDGGKLYDFLVSVGEESAIQVLLNASSQDKPAVTSTMVTTYGDGYARITSESSQTAILWSDPVIQKGE